MRTRPSHSQCPECSFLVAHREKSRAVQNRFIQPHPDPRKCPGGRDQTTEVFEGSASSRKCRSQKWTLTRQATSWPATSSWVDGGSLTPTIRTVTSTPETRPQRTHSHSCRSTTTTGRTSSTLRCSQQALASSCRITGERNGGTPWVK